MKRTVLACSTSLLFLSSIISCANLTYVHDDPFFSFEYPGGFYSKVPWGKNNVARLVWKTAQVPVFMAYVRDKPENAKLEDLTGLFIQGMEETEVSLSLIEEKKVKLSDGTDAIAAQFKWKLKNIKMPFLYSACVMTIKENKVISVTGTSSKLGGYQADRYMSMDEMMKYCMTLKLNS